MFINSCSISKPFCHSCNRGRLSADGKFFTCLFSNQGEDILSLIRSGMDKKGLVKHFSKIWLNRDDRYSLDRSNLNSKKSKIEKKETEIHKDNEHILDS